MRSHNAVVQTIIVEKNTKSIKKFNRYQKYHRLTNQLLWIQRTRLKKANHHKNDKITHFQVLFDFNTKYQAGIKLAKIVNIISIQFQRSHKNL